MRKLLVALACLLVAACDQEARRLEKAREFTRQQIAENALPADVVTALATTSDAELISLEPTVSNDAAGERLNNRLVLGSTRLRGDEARLAAAEFGGSVRKWNGMVAACFDPRHALRFRDQAHTYLLVICFDCGSMEVYSDGVQLKGTGVTGSPAALDGLLKAHHVKLARPAY